jgi:rhodanese-related sulfurtransferase
MSSYTTISPDKLSRLIGTAHMPALIDVRTDEDFAADQRLIPGAVRRSHQDAGDWSGKFSGNSAIVVCMRGAKLAQGTAAWLRHANVAAETLEGGFEGWKEAKLPLVNASKLPPRDAQGRTVWVTRARPKIDRIACPWLVARFVDPGAEFLYVPPKEVLGAAKEREATPYDVPDVHFSHDGDLCSFDAFVKHFRLHDPALAKLALIVRGADTAKLELASQAPGLAAISLGLSRLFPDDHEMLRHGMVMYDALYAWCKDGQDETHTWNPTACR